MIGKSSNGAKAIAIIGIAMLNFLLTKRKIAPARASIATIAESNILSLHTAIWDSLPVRCPMTCCSAITAGSKVSTPGLTSLGGGVVSLGTVATLVTRGIEVTRLSISPPPVKSQDTTKRRQTAMAGATLLAFFTIHSTARMHKAAREVSKWVTVRAAKVTITKDKGAKDLELLSRKEGVVIRAISTNSNK